MSIKYKEVPEIPEIQYPVLRKCINSEFVVLFIEPRYGIIIDQGSSSYMAGFHGQSWTPATCTKTWQPVEATISG